MKKCLLLLCLPCITLFSACSADDDAGEFIYGRWNLTKITNTSLGGTSTPNANNTHFYQLNGDGSFKRVATEDNSTSELLGTFVATNTNENYANKNGQYQKFITLSYSSEVRFFNCSLIQENKQLLVLTAEKLLQNTLSGACDGENYEYTKN